MWVKKEGTHSHADRRVPIYINHIQQYLVYSFPDPCHLSAVYLKNRCNYTFNPKISAGGTQHTSSPHYLQIHEVNCVLLGGLVNISFLSGPSAAASSKSWLL